MLLKEQPLVSIVIPCYNHEKYVQDCIKSVIAQTYQNIELIIIDDGSKDESVEKIQQLVSQCQERFVRFEFRHRSNKGLCATLNEALEWCQGQYYSAIASDDEMISHKTKYQVDFLEKHLECVALLGGVILINDSGKEIKKASRKESNHDFSNIFLMKHGLNVCTQMARLSVIKQVGCYNELFKIEDWYMWLKLANFGIIKNVEEIFVRYRLHEDNTIKKGELIYQGLMEIANEYKFHRLYLKAIKNIIWIRVAAIIISDKRKGGDFFMVTLLSDPMVIFSKNFYRCLRNFFK
ncbi:glycosyltransferase [Acinetobacter baumannii]